MHFRLSIFTIVFLNCVSVQAQEEFFIPGEGTEIYARIYGKGDPILIINGGPGFNSNGFEPLAQELDSTNKVILYDQRGTGKSPVRKRDSTTITLDLMVEDIETLRRGLNISQWYVLGHSFGGMLGSYYATKYPESIKGLILSSSGGIDLSLMDGPGMLDALDESDRDSLNYFRERISLGDTTRSTALKRTRIMAKAYLHDQSYVEIIAKRLLEVDMELNRMVWDDMMRENFDCKEQLKSFQSPVLILQGKNDILDDQIAKNTHNILPNSILVLMDDCAHYGWLDQPEIYFKSIYEFLRL